jgi:crotonobetainyl-CoA:carnitine CoA-transferase CaiB-like acyl-CoA transferase
VNRAPLEGVRVLEFAHAVLGPTTGLVLADLGAEVIRVEPAPGGDPTRALRGFGMGFFPFFNRNKLSIAVNVKEPRGREVVHRLLERADVLVENFAPGTMDRLGLGWETLHQRYRALIYCSLKGFMDGPYQDRVALDEVVQIMSGLAYMTGPAGQPLRAGASVIDIMTGIYGAMGVQLALRERDRDGKGRLVQSALFETAAFVMGHHLAYAIASGEPVPPMPERVSAWSVYHLFTTAGGEQVFIGVTSDKQWVRFCEAFERPDLAADQRLQTNNQRIAEREWLLPDLRAMIQRFPLAETLARCARAGVAYAPVARPEDLFADPQLEAGGSLLETTFPDGRKGRLPAQPLTLDGQRPQKRSDPPLIGEHTAQVLQEAGYTPEELRALEAAGVISAGGPDRPGGQES